MGPAPWLDELIKESPWRWRWTCFCMRIEYAWWWLKDGVMSDGRTYRTGRVVDAEAWRACQDAERGIFDEGSEAIDE